MIGQSCFCSLDGVDFAIDEPTPFSSGWYGLMVWVFGGYPCGQYVDLKLSHEAFVPSLITGERAMADKAYKDPHFIIPNPQNSNQHGFIMSRHETVSRRLKQFLILKDVYRHSLKKHPMIVSAVANVTQLMLQNGHSLFSVI